MPKKIRVNVSDAFELCCKNRGFPLATQARQVLEAFAKSADVRQSVANWQVESESKDEPKTYYTPKRG